MLRKLLLLCLSFECFIVSSWMSTLDIADYMDRALVYLWWTAYTSSTTWFKDNLYEGSLLGSNSDFSFAHWNGFWGHNLGWVGFSLITRLPQPKVGTGTRVLRELKRQMSSHFWEDVKGYLRRDMTISLERMKNKLNFLPVTFMKHSFPFVCGDRFLYFPAESNFPWGRGSKREGESKCFDSFSFFKDHFLRKQFDEFICMTPFPGVL